MKAASPEQCGAASSNDVSHTAGNRNSSTRYTLPSQYPPNVLAYLTSSDDDAPVAKIMNKLVGCLHSHLMEQHIPVENP